MIKKSSRLTALYRRDMWEHKYVSYIVSIYLCGFAGTHFAYQQSDGQAGY